MRTKAMTSSSASVRDEEFYENGRPIKVFRPSKVIFISPVAACSLLFAAVAYARALSEPWRLVSSDVWILTYGACVAITGLALLIVYVRWATTQFLVYEDRVVGRSGFIRRQAQSASLREVIGMNIDQSIDGRMMGYGDITVDTRGVENIRMRQLGGAREAVNMVMRLKDDLDQRREDPLSQRTRRGS